ncbi:hypothetical protein [Micromonospora sp. NPDC005203]|uniref:hypothetical protein n=1 Tax=Micromonospora sp. NPDC005203 TaxID=3364226 RepID=UPI0036CA5A65
MARSTRELAVATFVVWQVLIGAGNGVVLARLSTDVVTRAPADAVGISSGLFDTARAVGGAVSGAAFAAVMAALSSHVPGAATPVTVRPAAWRSGSPAPSWRSSWPLWRSVCHGEVCSNSKSFASWPRTSTAVWHRGHLNNRPELHSDEFRPGLVEVTPVVTRHRPHVRPIQQPSLSRRLGGDEVAWRG